LCIFHASFWCAWQQYFTSLHAEHVSVPLTTEHVPQPAIESLHFAHSVPPSPFLGYSPLPQVVQAFDLPAVSSQRLVFAGRVLDHDTQTLRAAGVAGAPQIVFISLGPG